MKSEIIKGVPEPTIRDKRAEIDLGFEISEAVKYILSPGGYDNANCIITLLIKNGRLTACDIMG
ncbi:MAG TPA: hypothetical protein DD405_07135 [Desulfobacteraceae bacterium]|nr:hypothetical protein [Desulfobacteraceae bacterium]